MDKYYYFVAQLPTLFFAKETEMSIERFFDEAQKWLTSKDYEKLSEVDINDFYPQKKSHRVLREFKDFEYQLRKDVALWRQAKKREQEYKPSTFPVSVLKESNPLEAEKKLMELRWTFIEERAREHDFDLGFLILYLLKLQILHRLFTFNKEQGLEKFHKLHEVSL